MIAVEPAAVEAVEAVQRACFIFHFRLIAAVAVELDNACSEDAAQLIAGGKKIGNRLAADVESRALCTGTVAVVDYQIPYEAVAGSNEAVLRSVELFACRVEFTGERSHAGLAETGLGS